MAQRKIRFFIVLLTCMFVSIASAQSQTGSGYEPVWIPNTDLIALSDGYTINIYNSNFTLISRLELFNKSEVDVNLFQRVWSPDGEKVAINAYVTNRETDVTTGILQIWQRESQMKLAEATGIIGGSPLAWNPTSDQVAAVAYTGKRFDDKVQIFRATDGLLLNTLLEEDEQTSVYQMLWTPQSSQLALLVSAKSGGLVMWDINTDQPATLISDSPAIYSPIAYNSDGNQIAFIEHDYPNQIQVWAINPLTHVLTIAGYTDDIWDFSWSGDKIISVGLGEPTKAWNTRNSVLLYDLPAVLNMAPSWKSDGTKYIGRATINPSIFDAATGAILAEMCETCVQSHSSSP